MLDDEESAYAARLLARKHPILHGILVPLAHRLKGYKTVHVELTPLPETGVACGVPGPNLATNP